MPSFPIDRKVNLSSKARETILRRQAGRPPACPPPADLFDEALAEVSIVLQRDPFVQFRNCAAFLRLKQRWAQKVGFSKPRPLGRREGRKGEAGAGELMVVIIPREYVVFRTSGERFDQIS